MAPPKLLFRRIPGAGEDHGAHPTVFELRRFGQIVKNQPIWHPFASRDEWELCEWIIESNLTQRATDRFLKGSLVGATYRIQTKSWLIFSVTAVPRSRQEQIQFLSQQ